MIAFAVLTLIAAEPAKPWEVTETALPQGWVFTPDFNPEGDRGWLAAWADPLNLEAPQRIYPLRLEAGRWIVEDPLEIAANALKDWPTTGRDRNELLISLAETRMIDGARVDDFDLWAVELTDAQPRLSRLEAPQLNQQKTASNATLGVAANELGAQLINTGDLWFWSQRPGASGGRDIFIARAAAPGTWSPPLEFPLNTSGRESHPWVSDDGRRVIFTSDRPGGLGGDDLWETRLGADGWAPPRNLGPLVNSAFDDEAARLHPSGTLFFTSNRPIEGRDARTEGAPDFRVYTVQLEDPL